MAYQNTRPVKEKIVILFKGYSSSDLVIHFHKTGGLTRDRLEQESMQQKDVLTFSLIGQVPETLDYFLYCSNTSCGCSGMNYQWCNSGSSNVLGLSTSDPLSQATQLGWSGPGLHPSTTELTSSANAFSVPSVIDLLALLFVSATSPSLVRALESDQPAKPQQNTLIVSLEVFQPCLLYCTTLLCELCSGAWHVNTHALHPCTPGCEL